MEYVNPKPINVLVFFFSFTTHFLSALTPLRCLMTFRRDTIVGAKYSTCPYKVVLIKAFKGLIYYFLEGIEFREN